MSKLNIAICTLTVGQRYQDNVALGVKSKTLYCHKWNYQFINETQQLDLTRPIPWSKIDLILRELPKVDYLVWLDADTIICNYDMTIESLLKMLPSHKTLLIGHDFNCINSGVMFIKNSSEMIELFTKIKNTSKYNRHIWWEQRALVEYYYDYKQLIEVLDHKNCHIINGYIKEIDPIYPFESDDWCLHLAGVRDSGQIAILMAKYFIQPEL